MGKHFVPPIYQRADERSPSSERAREKSKDPIQIYSKRSYEILHYPHILMPQDWFRQKSFQEYTRLFLVSFHFDTDIEQIYNLLIDGFDGKIENIVRYPYSYSYEIRLRDKLNFGEVFNRVHHALDGVVFDVIG